MIARDRTRRFVVCIHDATPAFARETRAIVRDLAPRLGRRFSSAVVPDWHGAWPLASHRDYCRMIQDASEELLLHGCDHRRHRGRGPITLLTAGSDEMNGMDLDQTRRTLERAQRAFGDVFGAPARGFLAPGWQTGHVRPENAAALGLEHILGFFSLRSAAGDAIPLATWSWDCGRWGWLGHVGHRLGSFRQSPDRVPVVAIHPRDVARGFWPAIVRLIRTLLDAGYEPATPAALLEPGARDVAAPARSAGPARA